MSDEAKFESWAIVELMGHVRMAGRVSEESHFGAALGRIDIPMGEGDDFVTQYFGGSSVYRVTPCDEATARVVAASNRPQPVHRYELPSPVEPTERAQGYAPHDFLPDENGDCSICGGDASDDIHYVEEPF